MPSFLDTLEDAGIKEEPVLGLPEKGESSFLDTLDDEGVEPSEEKLALPGEPVTTISTWEPTLFDRMRSTFRDPAKESANAAIAMIDSKMLNISPSQAMRLRNPIDRGVEINPAAAKIRKTLSERLGGKLDKGHAQVNSGLWNYEALTGNEAPEVLAGIEETEHFLSQPEAISESVLEDAVGSAAEMFPFLARSAYEGSWRGVILAGGTMLMGTAAGAPEVTYPLAAPMYAVGQTSASLEFVSKVEAGLAYSELRNYQDRVTGEKIDPSIAKAAAYGVGAVNGLLELAQMKTLIKTIPGGKKLLSGLILDTVKEVAEKKSLQDVAAKHLKRYGTTIVTETLQETAQESTNIVADILARKLTNELKGTELSMPEVEEITARLRETMKTSAQAFAVMGLPGQSISTGYDVVKQKRMDKAFEKSVADDVVQDVDALEDQIKTITNRESIERMQEDILTRMVASDYEILDEELTTDYADLDQETIDSFVDIDEILGDEVAEDKFIAEKMKEAGFEIEEETPSSIGGIDTFEQSDNEIAEFISKGTGYPIADRGEWYGEGNYKAEGGVIESMSPDEFLKKTKPLEVDEEARENIDDLKDHIQSGKTLDPLVIYRVDTEDVKASDGRHRAIASKELGINEVPVIVYQEDTPGAVSGIDQTKTPKFEQWFGDSKVVDEAGEPLVVYHGSPTTGHNVFISKKYSDVSGYFAADPTIASVAAEPTTPSEAESTNPGIYPVYLSLKNPVDLSHVDGEKDFTAQEFAGLLPFDVPQSVINEYQTYLDKGGYSDASPVWSLLSTDRFRSLMRQNGYDGVIYNESSAERMNETNKLLAEMGGTEFDEIKTAKAFIAFEPTQIKSATGNIGTFDPDDPNIKASIAPVWYSALEKGVENIKQETAPAQQWQGMIKKLPIKKEELEWVGLEEWLKEQKGKVSKQDILDFVRANNVEVQEVEKKDVSEEDIDIFLADEAGEGFTRSEAHDFLAQGNDITDVKFSKYQLPGGENYKELLLTLPEQKESIDSGYEVVKTDVSMPRQEPDYRWDVVEKENINKLDSRHYNEESAQQRLDNLNTRTEEQYKSSHFDEPNVLAHIRFNERTDAEGNKVLFIEEIQSDWHQEGRKKGYKEEIRPDQIKAESGKILFGMQNWVFTLPDGKEAYYSTKGEMSKQEAIEDFLANDSAVHEYIDLGKVPDAPFKKSWPLLAIKRMVRYAAENGFDKVAWTTGAQQAERYDLSKQISRVLYDPGTDKLLAYDHGDREVLNKKIKDVNEIEDYIGKEAAKRLLSEENTSLKRDGSVNFHEIEGVDLKVGGEGMKSFYDKMLPSMVNKFFKKYGAKVGDTSLPGATEDEITAPFIVVDNGRVLSEFQTERRAKEYVDKYGGTVEDGAEYGSSKVHSIDITPKMKESAISEGMPIADVGRAKAIRDAQPFHSSRIESKELQEAVESGLITTEEGAVIDGIMEIVGEKGWGDYFKVKVSGQKFTPSEAQLKAHGIPKEQAGMHQLEGVLLTDKSIQEGKEIAQNTAIIFQGGDVSTFFHEFGEFAYKQLLTGKGDKSIVSKEYKKSKSKQAENEWFADSFRDWWLKTLDGKSDVVSPELKTIFQKLVSVMESVWRRLKSLNSPTPAMDELFTDIMTKGREVEFGTGEISMPIAAAIDKGAKKRIRKMTGQTRGMEEKTVSERDALKFAFKKAVVAARKAMSEGNKEGVAKEKKRMAAILDRAKQRKKDSEAIKKVKAKITRELKSVKVKKQSGKPKGRFGAERQETLNLMRSWVIGKNKLTKENARLLLGDRMEKIGNSDIQIPTEFELLENKLLAMIGSPTPDLAFNESLLENIKDFKFTGEMARERKRQNRIAYNEMIIEEAIEIIGGVDQGKKQIGGKARPEDKPIKQRLRNFFFASSATNFVQAWDDLLDILSFQDKNSKPGESIISKFGDVHEQENAEKKGNMDQMENLHEIVMEVYGLKNVSQMTKVFDKDSEKVDLGTFKDSQGNLVDMEFTKAEARKMIMALLDPTLHDTFFSEKGEMLWSQDMVDALYEFMTPQDLEFIQKQMEWYQGYYNSINDVYKEIYGVNLPHNPFYSPISREGVNKEEDAGLGEFLKDAPFRSSASTAGSLKSRSANLNPISQQSDISVLMKHVMEMEHFKSWAQKIRDLNAVFNHPEVRTAIAENFGQNVNQHIETTIQDLASGGNERSNLYGFLDQIRIKYTQSVLAIKPLSLFVKQLSSVVTGADYIPIPYYSKEVTKLLAPNNLVSAKNELFENSVALKSRWVQGAMERDIAAAIKTDEYKAFKAKPSFMNKLMFSIRLGDMAAIIIGGYPVYKYYLEKTGDKKKAIRHFESFMSSTQQSSDISKLSSLQRGNSVMKLFTMFMTSPLQYFRKEMNAIRNMAAKRISKKQAAKTIMIYHFILPLFFQTLSELIVTGDDDDDSLVPFLTKGQKRAMIVGPLNGYLIVGDLLEYVISKAIGEYTTLPSLAPYGVGRDITKAMKLLDWDDLSDEEILAAIRGLAGAVGGSPLPLVGGKPWKQTIDIGVGVSDTLSGEWEKGLLEIGGWSPYAAEKATEALER